MKSQKLCIAALILFAVASAANAATSSSREGIISEVTRLGGSVQFDEARAGKPIIKIDLHGTGVTDSDLLFLNEGKRELKDLLYLDLRLTHIGDGGVRHLRNLEGMETLNLFRTNLSDRGLGYLHNLRQLKTLLIGGTRVTDSGLKHLRGFSQLRKLSLFQTQVTDAGIPHLKALARLEQLLISGTKITPAGMKELEQALPNLRFSEQT